MQQMHFLLLENPQGLGEMENQIYEKKNRPEPVSRYSLLACGFWARFLESRILLSPINTPLRSMTNSLAVIIPSILPCALSSRRLEIEFPINFPATISAFVCISPLTAPLFPIITVSLEWITPSKSPSICNRHSIFISPFIFVPCAMIVAPPEELAPSNCLLSLVKIAIIHSFHFQRLKKNCSLSIL